MLLTTLLRSLACLSALISTTLAKPIPFAIQRRSKEGPLIAANFPDPSLIQVDGSWYAFATSGNGKKIQAATSSDFNGWALLDGDALPTLATWANDDGPWAPDVVRMPDGTFVMYYSAFNRAQTAHCIGAATSRTVTGPYVPSQRIIVCPTSQGGAIDAAGFRDTDGTQYMTYKIDTNRVSPQPPSVPIMLIKMTADGLRPASKPIQLLDRSDADGSSIEAPSLVRMRDGTYVLFFSSNSYAGAWYDSSYATASKVTGPYTKAARPLLMSGDMASRDSEPLYSPGGLDIDVDGMHVVFHGGLNRGPEVRQMYGGIVAFNNGVVVI